MRGGQKPWSTPGGGRGALLAAASAVGAVLLPRTLLDQQRGGQDEAAEAGFFSSSIFAAAVADARQSPGRRPLSSLKASAEELPQNGENNGVPVKPQGDAKPSDSLESLRSLLKPRAVGASARKQLSKPRQEQAHRQELEETPPEMMMGGDDDEQVVLQEDYDLDATRGDILKNRWHLAKLFQLNPDFESQEFGDQMLALEFVIDRFRKEYLKAGHFRPEKFGDGIEEVNTMRETVAKLEVYRTANCLLYNTEGRKVDTIGKANFEKMCCLTKDLRMLEEDFKQRIRQMSGADFKAILDLPQARKFLPWLRAVRARHAVASTNQEIAINFAATAAGEIDSVRRKIGREIHQLERDELRRTLRRSGRHRLNVDVGIERLSKIAEEQGLWKALAAYLRWQTFAYCQHPGSRSPSADRTSYTNLLLAIAPKTCAQIRKGAADAHATAWSKYLAIVPQISGIAYGFARPKDQKPRWHEVVTARFAPAVLTGSTDRWEWDKIHATAVDAVTQVSPSFGKRIEQLMSEGRILWAKHRKAGEDFRRYEGLYGGKEAGALVYGFNDGPGQPSAVMAAKAYAEACVKESAMGSGEYLHADPCRDVFIEEIVRLFYQHSRATILKDSVQPVDELRDVLAELSEYASFRVACAYDNFETAIHTLCDGLDGGKKNFRPKEGSPIIPVEGVQKAWKATLQELEGPDGLADLKAAEGAAPFLLVTVPLLSDDMRKFRLQQFRMDRSNYAAMVRFLSRLAFRSAVKSGDGQLKTGVQNEQLIQTVLGSKASTDFEGYIRILGGNPDDAAYWQGLIKSHVESLLEKAQVLLEQIKKT